MAFLSPALASSLYSLQGESCSPVHTAPSISKLGNDFFLQASPLKAGALMIQATTSAAFSRPSPQPFPVTKY